MVGFGGAYGFAIDPFGRINRGCGRPVFGRAGLPRRLRPMLAPVRRCIGADERGQKARGARLEQSAARNWVLIDVVVQIAVRHEPRALSAPRALVWGSLCRLSLAFAQTLDRGIADPPCLDASGLIPGRPGKPSTAYAYAIPVRSLVLHTTRMDRREPPITRIRSIDRS
jgi:hypothetical protein